MAEETSNDVVPILIFVIVILVAKELYDWYKKLTRNHHEVYFVMMGEPLCCSQNDASSTTNKNCQKYCMGKLLVKIMNCIDAAKSSICIAMYNFSNHRIADCVLRAHRRGVKVRLVIDKSMSASKESKTQAKRLKDAGKLFKSLEMPIHRLNEFEKNIE